MMIDATIVRAHQHSAGARKKGGLPSYWPVARGLTTKIHVIIDAPGDSVAMSLTPGQASDLGQAEPLLDQFEPEALLADKAYGANALIDTFEERGIAPVIPSKGNRTVQRPLRLRPLPRTKPRRAFLRQTRGLPHDRPSLRQACQHLPGCNPAGLRLFLAQLTTRPRHNLIQTVRHD
jgi:transposase